jgi:hypothetical protein
MSCFDSDLFKDPSQIQDELFRCPVSGEILNNPVLDECGHTFCRNCFVRICDYHDELCPISRKPIHKSQLIPNLPIKAMLDDLELKCIHLTQGCGWEGNVREVDDHLLRCDYQFVICTNKCGLMIMRIAMMDHCNSCLMRPVICENCHKELPYTDYINRHLPKDCPEVQVICPNNCGRKLARKLVKNHTDKECPNSILNCQFEHYGCRFVCRRKKMSPHNQQCGAYHASIMNIHQNVHYSIIDDLLKSVMDYFTEEEKEINQSTFKPKLDLLKRPKQPNFSVVFSTPINHQHIKFPKHNIACLSNYEKLTILTGIDQLLPFNTAMVKFSIWKPSSSTFSVAIGIANEELRQKLHLNSDYDPADETNMILFKDIINDDSKTEQFKTNDYLSLYIDSANSKVVFENWNSEFTVEAPLPHWSQYWPVLVIGAGCTVESIACVSIRF